MGTYLNQPSRLLTRERTPQGYGSLKFNEDYSARREKAYKSERNMEYNEYLDKVSTVSYHLMYKKGGGGYLCPFIS